MNKQGVTSLGMAADMLKVAIDELQTTIDRQFAMEHYHRWKDGSVKLSRLRRIRKELLSEIVRLSHQDELDAENRSAGPPRSALKLSWRRLLPAPWSNAAPRKSHSR